MLYAAYLFCHISPYASGSDASGYINSARLLARGEFFAAIRPLPGQAGENIPPQFYQPLGFRVLPQGRAMVPTYPVGLPLHLAAMAALAGRDLAPIFVNIVAALAAGWLLYALGRRQGLPAGWAAAGTLLLWLCPLFCFMAFQPMSDLLATTWTLAALYAALRAGDSPPEGAKANEWRWALAGGACTGLAVLVRPTNILLALPLVVAMGWRPRRYLWLALGGLPFATLLGFYNYKLHGQIVTTGYGDVSSAFSVRFFPHIAAHFARWIPGLLSPLVVAALAVPFLPRGRNRDLVVLAAWLAPLIGFYSFYYHSGETWWYLRFILPAFPVLILAALLTAHHFHERWKPQAPRAWLPPALALLLLGSALSWEIGWSRHFHVADFMKGESIYLAAAQWMQAHAPADAVVFCMQVSGTFYYYTDFIVARWDSLDGVDTRQLFHSLEGQKVPVFAVLFPFELQDGALKRLGGEWRQLTTLRAATIWQRLPSPCP